MAKIILSLLIVFCLFFSTPALSFDSWTGEDTVCEVTFAGITAIDLMQTNRFVGDGYEERNPVLGKHPSRTEVNTLIPLAIAGHAIIAYMLPAETVLWGYKLRPRRMWQNVWIGIEMGAVNHNHVHGVRISF